jgi:hypothetical protein
MHVRPPAGLDPIRPSRHAWNCKRGGGLSAAHANLELMACTKRGMLCTVVLLSGRLSIRHLCSVLLTRWHPTCNAACRVWRGAM